MLKRYVPLLCLILFFGCKEGVPIYFRSPQPRGGKLFHGDIDQFLISNIPEKVHSHGNRYDELNDILFESLNDTLTSIEIDRYKNIAKVKLEFFNGLSWIEEFDLSDSSFFADSEEIELEDVILVKENIICFNKKNDKGYFEINHIWERDRVNGDIMIYDNPFSVAKKNSLENFNKEISYKRDEFDLEIVDINDTLETYSANPSYMAFRWGLKKNETSDWSLSLIYLIELSNAFEDRIKKDSTKYMALIDLGLEF